MGTWICHDDVLEASGRDLAIVVLISPAAQSTHVIVVEHCRVLGVGGIFHAMFQNNDFERDQLGHTEGPVPVWGHSGIAALVLQRVFKMLDKITMPRQEEPGEVNLKQ